MPKLLEKYLAKLKIYHMTVSLYAPAHNRLVERFKRVLSEKLKECERLNGTKITS